MSKALTRKRAPVGSIGTIRHAGADSLVFRDEFSSGTTSLFFVVCPIPQRRAGRSPDALFELIEHGENRLDSLFISQQRDRRGVV